VLIAEILPRATVLTPNVPEARALVHNGGDDHGPGRPWSGERGEAEGQDEAGRLIRAVLALGPGTVVLTGGHRDAAVDLFVDAQAPSDVVAIPGERHPDGAAHGSGCTHSSVLAAQLALGREPLQAAFAARAIAGEAVRDGLRDVGEGPGPVDAIGLVRARGA
jgi:hydroxymethylpyrimidine/phosphomethylpyrimidine kinase